MLKVDDNADDKDDNDLSRNNDYILEVLGSDIIRCRCLFPRLRVHYAYCLQCIKVLDLSLKMELARLIHKTANHLTECTMS